MVLRPRVVNDDEHAALAEQLAQALGRGPNRGYRHVPLAIGQLGDELAHPAKKLCAARLAQRHPEDVVEGGAHGGPRTYDGRRERRFAGAAEAARGHDTAG